MMKGEQQQQQQQQQSERPPLAFGAQHTNRHVFIFLSTGVRRRTGDDVRRHVRCYVIKQSYYAKNNGLKFKYRFEYAAKC